MRATLPVPLTAPSIIESVRVKGGPKSSLERDEFEPRWTEGHIDRNGQLWFEHLDGYWFRP